MRMIRTFHFSIESTESAMTSMKQLSLKFKYFLESLFYLSYAPKALRYSRFYLGLHQQGNYLVFYENSFDAQLVILDSV